MTGPAPGKIPVKDATVRIRLRNGEVTELKDAQVYIHIKGWSLAKVTHIDIEHPTLNSFFKPKETYPARIQKFVNGIRAIVYKHPKTTEIEIHSKTLATTAPTEPAKGVVGGKEGGVFIGVQKHWIKALEEYGAKCGYPPKT